MQARARSQSLLPGLAHSAPLAAAVHHLPNWSGVPARGQVHQSTLRNRSARTLEASGQSHPFYPFYPFYPFHSARLAGGRREDDRRVLDRPMRHAASSSPPIPGVSAQPSLAKLGYRKAAQRSAEPTCRAIDRRGHSPAVYTRQPSFPTEVYKPGRGYYTPNNPPKRALARRWGEPLLSTRHHPYNEHTRRHL